jgi:uncharacterized protein DUF6428
MLTLDKPVAAPWPKDAPARVLIDALAPHKDKALVFIYDGREVQPGYHVTEVKAARFDGLDCGANPESWHETFIQLWDVPPENDRGHLPVWKFLGIMKKFAAGAPFDLDGKLTFEVSDPQSAMRLYGASGLEVDGERVRVTLARRPASCKPRDHWLETATKAGATSTEQHCCR